MSRRFVAAFVACLAPLCAPAQEAGDGLPPGILLLSRIKRHIREQMARLPDYTCLETAQRYASRGRAGSALKPLDTVRREVLESGAKELYAAPGTADFREDGPGVFAGAGLSGTGFYATHVRNLFVNDQGLFQYRGEEDLGSRRAVRYDYRVPLLESGLTIVLPPASGRVATKGSFWADPNSLDLVRLDIEAYDIPPDLPLASSVSRIYYGHADIGGRSVVLPRTADVDLIRTSGAESRNLLEFTNCRSFQAESRIQFDAIAPEANPFGAAWPSLRALAKLAANMAIAIDLGLP